MTFILLALIALVALKLNAKINKLQKEKDVNKAKETVKNQEVTAQRSTWSILYGKK